MLTYYIQISNLAQHWNGVDLAHVTTPVNLLDVVDVQDPVSVVTVAERDAVVSGYHMSMDCENGFSFHSQPGYLNHTQ